MVNQHQHDEHSWLNCVFTNLFDEEIEQLCEFYCPRLIADAFLLDTIQNFLARCRETKSVAAALLKIHQARDRLTLRDGELGGHVFVSLVANIDAKQHDYDDDRVVGHGGSVLHHNFAIYILECFAFLWRSFDWHGYNYRSQTNDAYVR